MMGSGTWVIDTSMIGGETGLPLDDSGMLLGDSGFDLDSGLGQSNETGAYDDDSGELGFSDSGVLGGGDSGSGFDSGMAMHSGLSYSDSGDTFVVSDSASPGDTGDTGGNPFLDYLKDDCLELATAPTLTTPGQYVWPAAGYSNMSTITVSGCTGHRQMESMAC